MYCDYGLCGSDAKWVSCSEAVVVSCDRHKKTNMVELTDQELMNTANRINSLSQTNGAL